MQPKQNDAKRYVPGRSCGRGRHEYHRVPGRRYARCQKCGSTRTVTAG